MKFDIALDKQWRIEIERWDEGHSRFFPLPDPHLHTCIITLYTLIHANYKGPGSNTIQAQIIGQGHLCLNPLQFVQGNRRGWQFCSFSLSLTHVVVSREENRHNIERTNFSAHLLYLRDGRLVNREERVNHRLAEGDSIITIILLIYYLCHFSSVPK